jgi:hypothetical protein
MQELTIFSVIFLGSQIVPAWSKGFLVHKGDLDGVNIDLFEREVESAMGAMLGCGNPVDKDHISKIEAELFPMWRTLPKNSYGRVERRTLRYLAHRHFMKKSSLLVRGFEPSRPVNSSHWGAADILSQQVPAYVESRLESERALKHGFSLNDAAFMIVMLEKLIFDSESTLLEQAYAAASQSTTSSLSHKSLSAILENYMVYWLMGDDQEGIEMLMKNRTLLTRAFPHWGQLVAFAEGQLKTLEFARQSSGQKNALSGEFSFDDSHAVVGGITKSFSSFWESECASMKAQLVEMDTLGTGRVKLSKFYGTGLDADWRFGESESYLRELGALDETSRWLGKQVIIPNYMQAASNCIVSTAHYLVCCVNECESLLGEIEQAIGSSVATPSELLAVVGNMTSQTTIDDDAAPMLKGSLTSQLEDIGRKNGGVVPLHGRLFAQWLHYTFPRECPFPHKTGTATSSTPSEFGDSYLAQKEDMQRHAESDKETPASFHETEGEWMSQWSHEEELMVEYSGILHAPWEGRGFLLMLGMLALLLVGLYSGAVGIGNVVVKGKVARQNDIWMTKSHLV